MDVKGSVALVTGAGRGIGAAFCEALLAGGAAKVYAGVRDIDSATVDGVVPVRLDVTSASDIAAAAARCGDVTLLVNNAGISTSTATMADNALEQGRSEFETNVFGPLALSRAFAPILSANGGGAIINVLSVLSWASAPQTAMYSASKAAAWSLTNSMRLELRSQGTHVLALHMALVDTGMSAHVNAPKLAPADVAAQTLASLRAGAFEVLADEPTRAVRAALGGELTTLYPQLARPD